MGEELQRRLGTEIDLVAGSNGVFDVSLDGRMIFSKFEQGRFPQPDEIVNLVKGE